MKITKRDGSQQEIRFDKILSRVKRQITYDIDQNFIDPHEVTQKVIRDVKDGMSSYEMDTLISEVCASMISRHPDYGKVASRIGLTRLHKETDKSFVKTVESLYEYINPKTGDRAGMISDETYKAVKKNQDALDGAIIHDRDFEIDYFGFKTLEKSYLLKIDGKIAERPQHMWMRVAVGIWGEDLDNVLKTYDLMSQLYFTHATPTLFNSGTRNPQMSSCFLVSTKDDSINGIFDTVKDCAMISKFAGGIGVNIHNLRSKGSYIRGTNGSSNGIVPWIKVLNETARGVDQGGGKRKGSFAVYLEPWHADVFDFLDLKKNTGKEELRARDLFYALWIPDLFMERVKNDQLWSLMDPNTAKGLDDVWGPAFDELYTKYEGEGKYERQVKARDLWAKIIESQIETGTPYMLYKDHANKKSNQQNLGTIKSSNLCTEIIEYSSPEEIAVCNLASLALPKFIKYKEGTAPKRKTKRVKRENLYYDFNELYEVTYQAVLNLNRVIDVNHYPTPETERSNLKHRPIGLGVQGLADAFAILGLSFTGEEAQKLNSQIFETIYFAAMTASVDEAEKNGHYETFPGSPLSEGKFQFDLWDEHELSGLWDWEPLRHRVQKTGARNSLLVAPMPTASTSQILGNNECFEPFTNNIYVRRTLSGEFVVVNKHLVRDLIEHDLWNDEVRNLIIKNNGSVQGIAGIPENIQEVYKKVWEIKQKDLIKMSADRARFICQSQSMNLFIEDVNAAKLSSAHMYSWEQGLKTGMYYLRTQPSVAAIKGLGIDMSKTEQPTFNETIKEVEPPQEIDVSSGIACAIDDPDCLACGS